MRFTRSLSLAAISVALLALAAPVHLLASKHPKYGGTLRLELQISKVSFDPREWKPGSVASAQNAKLAALIFDRLLNLDAYGRFQPGVALDWSHDAACKVWQFNLRSGVKFSDGSLLLPKDVVTSLEPLLPHGVQIVVAENGVTIRSGHPVPDLLEQLASGRYFIYRLQSDGPPIGTGPFVLAESLPPAPAEGNPAVQKPARIKFRANDDCWSGRPFLDILEITLGNPPLRQILNLQVGRTDVIDIPPDLVHKARQDKLRVWSSEPATLLALRFDDAQPATGNPLLREALDLALDRDTMANVLLQKQALPAPALLPQWLSGYAFLFGTSVNLDRAKQIRAGLTANVAAGSAPVRLSVDAPGDLLKLLGERVAVNARQANIAVQPVPRSPSATNPVAPAAGLHLFAWHYDSLSAQTELVNFAHALHLTALPGTTTDTQGPEKLYAQEQKFRQDRQVLPLVLLPDYLGIAPSVRNWSAAPSGEWRIADVWIDTGDTTSDSGTSLSRNPAPGVHP